MKAYLYMRFSSAEQAKGDSLQRQRALASQYLAEHPDIELDEELMFVDEGVSSFAGQNLQPGRGLHRFLECVEDGRVAPGSLLLVESLDRLSRQEVVHAQRLLLDILISGITVVTTSMVERKEYTGRSGITDLIGSLAGMERANKESAQKSDRVRSAWKRKKANAALQKLTRRAPSWLVLSDDRKMFHVDDDKAAVVRRIFELADSIGQQSIARMLNEESIPAFQSQKRGWHASSVVKVLNNPAVIGIYQPHTIKKTGNKVSRIHDGVAIPDYYPRIIDDETFYRVRSLRTERRNGNGGRKGKCYTNLFSGIAKCAACGSSMVVVDKGLPPKGAKYFVCSAARRATGCQYRAVRYRECEFGFLTYCQRVDVSEILPGGARKAEAQSLRKRQSSLLGEVEQTRGVMSRMLHSVEANGGDVPRVVQEQLVSYENRIDALSVEAVAVSNKLKVLEAEKLQLAGMRTMFFELLFSLRNATEAEKYILRSKLHAVLKAAIDSIEIGEANEEEKSEIRDLISKEKIRFEKNRGKPGYASVAPVYASDGRVTRFRVMYKNGNRYDLFIDSKEVAAGRMTYSPEAAAIATAKGQGVEQAQELHLAVGYGLREVTPRPRTKDGKFSSATGTRGE